MASQQEISDKLNQIIANEPSKWLEEAHYRFENKAWLKKSQAIALSILRHIRVNGISQKHLAERLNVAPQQVNRWVKGSENFTLETISKIEIVLGIQLINVSDTLEKNESAIPFKKEMPVKFDKNKFSTVE
jgi:ribosome-binding protein aMBF1 (putative translation factor)